MLQELSNDIKNAIIHWVLTAAIAFWSFRSPPGLHLPKWELPWECECSLPHTPSHFLTLPGVHDVTPGLLFGPHPCNAFTLTPGLPSSWPATLQSLCLGREPKARVATSLPYVDNLNILNSNRAWCHFGWIAQLLWIVVFPCSICFALLWWHDP